MPLKQHSEYNYLLQQLRVMGPSVGVFIIKYLCKLFIGWKTGKKAEGSMSYDGYKTVGIFSVLATGEQCTNLCFIV